MKIKSELGLVRKTWRSRTILLGRRRFWRAVHFGRTIRLKWAVRPLIFSNRFLLSNLIKVDRAISKELTSATEACTKERTSAHGDDDVLAVLISDERHERLDVFVAELLTELRVERGLLDKCGCAFGQRLRQTSTCGCACDTSSTTSGLLLNDFLSDFARPTLKQWRSERLTRVCGHNRLEDGGAKGTGQDFVLYAGVFDVVATLLRGLVQPLHFRREDGCASASASTDRSATSSRETGTRSKSSTANSARPTKQSRHTD